MNNSEVASIVKVNGLGYAIHLMLNGGADIEDGDLKITWQTCHLLIKNIERMLEEEY